MICIIFAHKISCISAESSSKLDDSALGLHYLCNKISCRQDARALLRAALSEEEDNNVEGSMTTPAGGRQDIYSTHKQKTFRT